MSFEEIANTSSRHADTYRLTEAERDLILTQVGTSGQALFNPAESTDVSVKLESLKRKELTLSLHSTTLAEYIRVQRIPRGLRSNLTPNLLLDDKEYISHWYGICNQFSFDLMLLTIKHIQLALRPIQEQISTIEKEIEQLLTAEKLVDTQRRINETTTKLRENILKVKLRKFRRDTQDYEADRVYTWNKARKQQEGRHSTPPPQHHSPGASTSDSDSGSSDGRRRRDFLGIQRTVENRQPSNEGDTRPNTRSWTQRGRGRSTRRR